jgi:hypothetical protein
MSSPVDSDYRDKVCQMITAALGGQAISRFANSSPNVLQTRVNATEVMAAGLLENFNSVGELQVWMSVTSVVSEMY